MHTRRRKHDFTSSPKCHLKRNCHHRLLRKSHTLHHGLKSADNVIEILPLFLLSGHENQKQICSSAKMNPLICNQQTLSLLLYVINRRIEHCNHIIINRIHLRVKLTTENAILKINEASACILSDNVLFFLFYSFE